MRIWSRSVCYKKSTQVIIQIEFPDGQQTSYALTTDILETTVDMFE